MADWYYMVAAGHVFGPVRENTLRAMLWEGKLSPETLVRADGGMDWVPACDVVDGRSPLAEGVAAIGTVPSGPQIRPWFRFWAREIDGGVALALVAMAAAVMDAYGIKIDRLAFVLFLMAKVFFEPLLLSTWGTTPGKFLFNIKVMRQDGGRLGYGEALFRTLKVWIFGLAIGLPLLDIWALIRANYKLRKQGITSWDKEGGFCVTHRFLTVWRRCFLAALVIGGACLAAWCITDMVTGGGR